MPFKTIIYIPSIQDFTTTPIPIYNQSVFVLYYNTKHVIVYQFYYLQR